MRNCYFTLQIMVPLKVRYTRREWSEYILLFVCSWTLEHFERDNVPLQSEGPSGTVSVWTGQSRSHGTGTCRQKGQLCCTTLQWDSRTMEEQCGQSLHVLENGRPQENPPHYAAQFQRVWSHLQVNILNHLYLLHESLCDYYTSHFS